jgi:hypothetical protein
LPSFSDTAITEVFKDINAEKTSCPQRLPALKYKIEPLAKKEKAPTLGKGLKIKSGDEGGERQTPDPKSQKSLKCGF